MKRLIDSDFPLWNESCIDMGFEYSIQRLGDIEGVPDSPVSGNISFNLFKKYFT